MNNIRLSKFIKPERYELTIKPNLEGFTFSGEEIIFLNLEKATKEVTLHAKELQILDAEFIISDIKIQIKNISYNVKNETATLVFLKNLAKGKGKLKLSFNGILNDQMRGFYRSRYEHGGKQKHMATTQFEATDARRAFPCFDEPAHKAIFDITLMVPNGLTAISNTIESSVQEDLSGYKVVKFAPTPKMSTYLVAFIIGDFEYIEGWAKGSGSKKTLVRVFVTPGKKHQAKFALDTAIKCLEFYNEYFDIPYPLPVLDLIAIPDFSHGAMENWGAVTYRESALLVDPENSSSSNKQWVALVIAHELAHQWFGNLVTMEWWTHLWLNEGFASYIEYLAVDKLFPGWDIWTQFGYADLGVALKLDGLKHTHPIEVEVHHPDEIGEIFDEVSYSKGASVIRMLAGYLGEKDFRDGLRYYLKKHSYQNASTIHLWQALEKISKKPVKKMMQNWTAKAGYPVLSITEKPKSLVIEQSRFFSSPISKKQSGDRTVWNVPVLVQNSKSQVQKYLLSQKYLEVPKPKADWIKINPGETGFFRTEYPPQMLEQLQNAIISKKISALDRLALIRDAFALSESGDLLTTNALELVKAYKNETDYTVWIELASGLATVKNLIYGHKNYAQFEAFARGVFKDISKQVGWQVKKGESHTTGLLRSLVLGQMANYNDPETLSKGLNLYKNSSRVPADIRSLVYHTVAQQGGEKEFKNFVQLYKKESLSEEKNRFGRALGQFSNAKLLLKTLEFALSEDVRIQDTAQIFAAVWANPQGREVAWLFTKKYWATLLKRYPSSGHMMSRFIKPVSCFVTEEQAKDVEKFFKKNSAAGANRAVAQVLEKIYSNTAWLKRDAKNLDAWLQNL